MHKLLWKIRTPQRLKTFMWLVMNDALLTNFSLIKRGMTANDLCVFVVFMQKQCCMTFMIVKLLTMCG